MTGHAVRHAAEQPVDRQRRRGGGRGGGRGRGSRRHSARGAVEPGAGGARRARGLTRAPPNRAPLPPRVSPLSATAPRPPLRSRDPRNLRLFPAFVLNVR